MTFPIFCDDLPGECCDSCHQDEDYDSAYSLWWDIWLHACCRRLNAIKDAGVDWQNEAAVRAWLATLGDEKSEPSS